MRSTHPHLHLVLHACAQFARTHHLPSSDCCEDWPNYETLYFYPTDKLTRYIVNESSAVAVTGTFAEGLNVYAGRPATVGALDVTALPLKDVPMTDEQASESLVIEGRHITSFTSVSYTHLTLPTKA